MNPSKFNLQCSQKGFEKLIDDYWVKTAPGHREEERQVEQVCADIRGKSIITKEELIKIAHWKSPRIIPRIEENDDYYVQRITKLSLTTSNPRFAIESLTLLIWCWLAYGIRYSTLLFQ